MAKRLQLYRAYSFKQTEKDPVIHKIHTMLDDAGVSYHKAAQMSGVSASCISAWIEGETRRPQYATIAAVAGALGYEAGFVKKDGSNVVNIRKRKVA